MNAIGDLLVKIKADTSDLEKGIASASKSMQNAGDSMVATGARLTAGVSAPLLGIGVAAIKAAADFETNMAVLKSVSSATSDEMEKMQQLAIALGNDLTIPGASASDAADAMVELAKAGLSVNDTMSAAKGVLQLAAAGELSTGEAATTAAAALNAFHLQGSEATRVADLLAAAANASAADVRTVGDSMKMAAAVFASAKVPVQDLTTAIALMANSGIQGSDAGTSLKQMLLSLQAPTKKAKDLMADLGIKIYDAQGNMLPMRSLIDNVSKALSGLTQQQRNAALSTIFGSDAIRAANIVLASGTAAWDAMSGAVNKAGAANQLASARMEGLNGAFAALKNSIETLLLTAALPFMDTLKNIVMFISDGVTQLANINPQFLNAAIAVGAVLAVAGPLTIAIGAIVGVIGTLLSPIGLVVLAVAGLSAAFASGIISVDAIKLKLTEFEPIFSSLSSIFQAFSVLVQEVWIAILRIISPIIANINTFLQQHGAEIQTWLGDTWTRISGIIQTAIQIIYDVVVPILNAIGKFLQEHSTEIQTFLSGAWQVISDTISGVLTFIQGLLQTVLKAINGDWEGAWETAKTTVSSAWEYISKALETVLGVIWGFIQIWLDKVSTQLSATWNAISTTAQTIWGNIKTDLQNKWNATLNAAKTIWNAIKTDLETKWNATLTAARTLWNDLKTAINNRVTETRDNIVNLFLAIKNFIVNRVTEIKDNVADTFNRIKTAVVNRFNETRDAVMNTAKNWVERMIKAGEQLIQGLIDGIGAMKDKLVRAIGWIIDKAVQAVLDALGIHSPSRVFFDIGQNTMQGLINGIEDQRTNLMSLMDDVVSDMIDRFAGVDVTPGIQFGRVDNPYGVPGNVGIINPNTGIIEILPLPKPPEFVAPGIVGGGNGGPGGIGNIADGPKPIWLMTAAEWAERFGVSLAQAMIELANLQNQMLNPNLGLDPGRHDFAPPPGVIGGNYPGQLNPVLPPVIPVIPGPGNPIGPGGGIPTGPIPIGGITDAIEVINRAQGEIVRRLGEMNSVISNNLSQIGTKIVADSAGVAISYFNSGKQAMDFLVGGLEAGIPALMDELSKINRIMTAGIGNGNVPAAGKGQLSNNTSYNITVNNPVAEKAGDSVRRELFYLSAGVLA